MPCVINLSSHFSLVKKKKSIQHLGQPCCQSRACAQKTRFARPGLFLQKCFLVLTVSRGTDLRMCQPVGHAEGRALKGGTGQEAEPICRRLLWALGNWGFSCFSHIVGVTLSSGREGSSTMLHSEVKAQAPFQCLVLIYRPCLLQVCPLFIYIILCLRALDFEGSSPASPTAPGNRLYHL